MMASGGFWAATLITNGVCIAFAATYCLHMRSIARDILNEERRRLRARAEVWAEREARRRVIDLVRHLQINVPITLVNESDIAWGDETEQRRRQDAN